MNVTTKGRLFQIALPATRDIAKSAPRTRGSRAVRTLLGAVGSTAALIAGVAVIGASYEAIAGSADHSTYPAPGRLVDLGGYRLHLDCRGEGSPTVVMDAGLGGSSLDWSLVQAAIASTTRVCTYDRAGMGWSDASPLPRTPRYIADELHVLLTKADVPGPYILVGHSLAGKNVRLFASAHPDEVAGMVLVDARSEHVDALTPKTEVDAFHAALRMQGTIYSLARRFGVARAFGASLASAPLLSPAIAAEMVLQQTQDAAIDETTKEGLARSADDAALADTTLGSMPLVVISAAASMAEIPNWPMAQRELAALSTQGKLVVAEHSGHTVQIEEPAIVIDGISQVIALVRSEH